MIPQFVRTNVETLLTAFEMGRVVLMECKSKVDGSPVYVLCAVNVIEPTIIAPGAEPEYFYVPLAKMFAGDPDNEVIPAINEKETPNAAQ